MKYLIIKGWLGFGDRLESLKMGIKYALDNNLKVYVDWTDSMWSHGDENFYKYFKLVNIPQIESLDEIPEDATVYPSIWKGRLNQPLSTQLLELDKNKEINLGILFKSYDADVVVVSNCGRRSLYNDNAFFANVFRVIDPRILSELESRKNKFPLSTMIGVHIRGTDKFKSRQKCILGVQYAAVNSVMGGALNGKAIVVVSDDVESMKIWKNFFPQSTLLSKASIEQNSMKGNHNLSKDELKITKDELNVDLLVDFFTLCLTSYVIATNKDSRFSQEARRLHVYVNKLLGQ